MADNDKLYKSGVEWEVEPSSFPNPSVSPKSFASPVSKSPDEGPGSKPRPRRNPQQIKG